MRFLDSVLLNRTFSLARVSKSVIQIFVLRPSSHNPRYVSLSSPAACQIPLSYMLRVSYSVLSQQRPASIQNLNTQAVKLSLCLSEHQHIYNGQKVPRVLNLGFQHSYVVALLQKKTPLFFHCDEGQWTSDVVRTFQMIKMSILLATCHRPIGSTSRVLDTELLTSYDNCRVSAVEH